LGHTTRNQGVRVNILTFSMMFSLTVLLTVVVLWLGIVDDEDN